MEALTHRLIGWIPLRFEHRTRKETLLLGSKGRQHLSLGCAQRSGLREGNCPIPGHLWEPTWSTGVQTGQASDALCFSEIQVWCWWAKQAEHIVLYFIEPGFHFQHSSMQLPDLKYLLDRKSHPGPHESWFWLGARVHFLQSALCV